MSYLNRHELQTLTNEGNINYKIFLYFFHTLYYFSILLFVCVFFLPLFQKITYEIGLLRKIEFLSYIIDRILLTE